MIRQRTSFTWLAAVALVAGGTLLATGCDTGESSASVDDSGNGSISLGLTGTSLSFASASYTMSGPASYSKTGMLTASNGVLSGLIGGVPAGAGYMISLNATTADGSVTCTGSGNFDVIGHTTTSVNIPMVCREAVNGGGVSVTGTTNVCPVVDGVGATPPSATVSTSVALTLSAHDKDMGPSALTYHWTATAGTFSDANEQEPTFTCPATAGSETLTVTVGDGSGCTDMMTLTVTCTP
jgi:Bacterial Ig domain